MTPPTQDDLTHFDAQGRAHMVDVGAKPPLVRTAVARGVLAVAPATLAVIQAGTARKGDVLGVARIAGIQAAKRCGDLIPLCHPLALTHVAVDFELGSGAQGEGLVTCTATARAVGPTGVEMEALCAVQLALLTVYDMVKAIDKAMVLRECRLLEKTKLAPPAAPA